MDEALKIALAAAFEGIKADSLDVITLALPSALGILAVFLVVRLGVSFFKTVAKA